MKGEIYICTVVERVNVVRNIVGDTLIDVSELGEEVLIRISATEEEWSRIKPELLVR